MFLKPYLANYWRLNTERALHAQRIPVKTAIVMMNMGGPQNTDQVHDYLHRIMTDTDMIQLPLQNFLGPWIARRRTKKVQIKYDEIGGSSPILQWTDVQGRMLCERMDEISPETAPHRHYVAFRYVTPLTEDALRQIEADKVQRVVFFSQYPQYSCATSGSSFNAIYSYFKTREIPDGVKWSVIDRWSTHPFLIKTFAHNITQQLNNYPKNERSNVIIIFSAHSLPLKAVSRGDSYPSEVGATVLGVMQELGFSNPYALTWQSKVGPLPWLQPFTDDAIKGYAKQGAKDFIMVPIAFVNEHIETLHEMDIEYCKDLIKQLPGVKICRVPAPNDHPLFVDSLADIVSSHLRRGETISPKFLLRCPHCVNPKCRDSKQWFSQLCGKA